MEVVVDAFEFDDVPVEVVLLGDGLLEDDDDDRVVDISDEDDEAADVAVPNVSTWQSTSACWPGPAHLKQYSSPCLT